ncbi:cupin domain-containing protein [Thioalkalivibrio sulfidiphilus]|uniref:Cupin 2, conserved barrel n=1 Tax=Thioalkalivibrio sulfidiphilus (strain HL-EbGR7) TaxID=396588 RepID=B8GSJ3_THISH|nr:cupin domain-containing protein [Thioalkalivibrio sulfidiphilus]ACL72897.1 cupin 2, conserved barrel [Thioalkalivibrio sulfidiphilus HL-EbGr7]
MSTMKPTGHTRQARVLFLLLLFAMPLAAETGVPEQALARTFSDADLQWGPCPSFIPAGCEIAVLHGDPAKQNADIFFKVPGGGFLVPHHRHTSAERMVLVSGQLQVQYEGQETVSLKPGTYAYGPAERTHTAVCESPEACVLFIAFEGPVDAYAIEVK